jgi:enoyl-CoA hydratase/carnithine racemase
MNRLTLLRSAGSAIAAAAALYVADASAAPASAVPEVVVHPIAAEAPDAKIRLTRVSPAYWKVTFASPPLNIVGPTEVRELAKIVDVIEADKQVQVLVFESNVPGNFIAHYDLLKPLEESTGMKPGPTGMHPVPDLMVRIARLPVITIVSIRGRASGIGSELALAADMRFASREKAVLSQFEVGAGMVPGGGPMSRLPRLIGRGRAMEILVAGEDINGELAERYGYVNRAVPDAELDGFVDAMARRIASFEHDTVVDIKKLVNVSALPPDAEMKQGWDSFIGSVQRPGTQKRLQALVGRGMQTPGDVETNLGRATAEYRK